MQKPLPVAALTSDWHLRVSTPSSRAEPNWYTVMSERLEFVVDTVNRENIPLLIAGDLFDRPDPPASLINFAHVCLGGIHCPVFAIAGQHDMVNHDPDNTPGLQSLRRTGVMSHLVTGTMRECYANGTRLHIWPMPWGYNMLPDELSDDPDGLFICMLHKYIHAGGGTCYLGASNEDLVTSIYELATKFNLTLIGDNHIPWRTGNSFFNHGSMFSMTSAQIDHKPGMGILYSNGTVEVIPYPGTPVWHPAVHKAAERASKSGLVPELDNIEIDQVGFESLVSLLESKSEPRIQEIIRELRRAVFKL